MIGILLYAPADALTSMSRGVAEAKPLWQRIFSSALLMALLGWLLGGIYGPDETLLTAIVSGAVLGLLGLRLLKLALGVRPSMPAGCTRSSASSTSTPAAFACRSSPSGDR